jgi:hypothetical protein
VRLRGEDSAAYDLRIARRLQRDEETVAAWIAEVMAYTSPEHPPCRLCIAGAAHRLDLPQGQRRELVAIVAEAVDAVALASHADPFARSADAAARYRGRRRSRHAYRCSECDSTEHTAPNCEILWRPRAAAEAA